MPKEKITYSHNQHYMVSNEYLDYLAESGQKSVYHDIKIEVPNGEKQEYYFDIEIGYDFLTADIEGTLLMKNSNGKGEEWITVGDTLVVTH